MRLRPDAIVEVAAAEEDEEDDEEGVAVVGLPLPSNASLSLLASCCFSVCR